MAKKLDLGRLGAYLRACGYSAAEAARMCDHIAEYDDPPNTDQTQGERAGGAQPQMPLGFGIERFGALDQKVQAKFDKRSRDEIQLISDYHRIPASEVVRTAFRVFRWARSQVAKGRDVGAYDLDRDTFFAFDVPFASPALAITRAYNTPDAVAEVDEQDEKSDGPPRGDRLDESSIGKSE